MKAVILAAGEGTRMRPLTATCPKVMLPVANRPILEHIIKSARDGGITDFVCVVGYRSDVIREYFGDGGQLGIHIDYVEQKQQFGTAHAIGTVQEHVGDRFIVMNGDALVKSSDVRSLMKHREDVVMAVKEIEDPFKYGVVKTSGDRIVEIIEKPECVTSNLVNAGMYLFSDSIFESIGKTGRSERGEYEITDSIMRLISDNAGVGYMMLDTWIDIGMPWNLLDANEFLLSGIQTEILGEVEPYATLKGEVIVGEGTIIRNGSYIAGPAIIGNGCDIGPNCYIRPGTSVGDNVRIGNAVEIKNSIIMGGTHVGHLSYLGDSVIGHGCNFGAGTKVANLRHDGENIRVAMERGLTDTGRRKLGVIMGDGVHTGINTSINVGMMIAAGGATRPGEVVGAAKTLRVL
ncbi:MAG: NTP transferase domain-containing protein [Methanosarcinales archaeon]|nr:NTP transferase domain-containing protein [Methanosarcinales archaeon]